MGPGVGESLRGGVGFVDNKEPGFLLFGVRFKIAPDEVAVPLPVVFAVSSGVDADETAAMMDIVLQCGLFPWAENFAGRAEEDQRSVFAEDLSTEPGRVNGRVDGKTILGAQAANGGDPGGNA